MDRCFQSAPCTKVQGDSHIFRRGQGSRLPEVSISLPAPKYREIDGYEFAPSGAAHTKIGFNPLPAPKYREIPRHSGGHIHQWGPFQSAPCTKVQGDQLLSITGTNTWFLQVSIRSLHQSTGRFGLSQYARFGLSVSSVSIRSLHQSTGR